MPLKKPCNYNKTHIHTPIGQGFSIRRRNSKFVDLKRKRREFDPAQNREFLQFIWKRSRNYTLYMKTCRNNTAQSLWSSLTVFPRTCYKLHELSIKRSQQQWICWSNNSNTHIPRGMSFDWNESKKEKCLQYVHSKWMMFWIETDRWSHSYILFQL